MCVGCGCRLEQARERSRDIEQAENLLTPEARAEIIETVARLLARLVEAGPAMDPQMQAALRAQLLATLAQLGIDPTKDQWGILYGEMIYKLFHDRQFPRKPVGYPEFTRFQAKINELLKSNSEVLGDLRGRDGMELAEYLYGLGFVLASQLSYEFIFPKSDPIVVSANGEIEGRHRYLTLAILEDLGLDTSRWRWVHVEHTRS